MIIRLYHMIQLNVLYLLTYSFRIRSSVSKRKKTRWMMFWLSCNKKYSELQIVKILKNDEIKVSQKTVSERLAFIAISLKKLNFLEVDRVTTQSLIIKQIDIENLPTQCSIVKSYHISQSNYYLKNYKTFQFSSSKKYIN